MADLIDEEENFKNNLLELVGEAFNKDIQVQIEDLERFTELFAHPCNISYSDEAKQLIYDKILKNDFIDDVVKTVEKYDCLDRVS